MCFSPYLKLFSSATVLKVCSVDTIFDGKLQPIVLVVEEFVFSLSYSGYVLAFGELTMGN